jgi:hypothetical protein
VKRTHVVAVAALIALCATALTGCFSGRGATTNMQATMNSGNGVTADAGPIHIENATLVLGPDGSKSATLLVRMVNTGPTADTLLGAAVNGVTATITEGAGELAPGASVSFGFDSKNWINAYDLDVPASTYVPVQLAFKDAGLVTMSVLTVPPVGYYEGIAPNPATNPAPVASVASSPSPTQAS